MQLRSSYDETFFSLLVMSPSHTSSNSAHTCSPGADIIMALDDVVPATMTDAERFKEATYRTTRWIDRCISAHSRPTEQNLFAIVQGAAGVHAWACVRPFLATAFSVPSLVSHKLSLHSLLLHVLAPVPCVSLPSDSVSFVPFWHFYPSMACSPS